jgi:polysaccharide export outer membrane protein
VSVSQQTGQRHLGRSSGAWGLILLASTWAYAAAAQQTRPKPSKPAAQTSAPKPAETQPAPVASPAPKAEEPAARPEASVTFEPATARELALGYPLGIGDVVRVNVFQQPDMLVETRVSEAGTVTVPLLGPVAVAGVTAKRAEDRIAALLKARGFVREPQVSVTVLQFKSRQVSVLGWVSRPGRYALEEGVYRLSDVLALAGGALPEGSDVVTLVRVVEGRSQKYEIDLPNLFRSGDFSMNPEIIAGDSIYVARAPLFYIYGEVNRPGPFRIERGMTLMQALAMGGGVTLRGTERNVEIRRRDASGGVVTLKSPLTEPVQADDVIYVRESIF